MPVIYHDELMTIKAFAYAIKNCNDKDERINYISALNRYVNNLIHEHNYAASCIETIETPNGQKIIRKIELFGNGNKSTYYILEND